ncbi:aminotransferase class I/II-fold pyridoxal phosphate-dependent enzyme [Klebsiella michiganensis]|uniref:DegT/DnrJ/EryC1/StrS family aminotransferase n=1 Tax=Klebsiella michiganensis TaxID=1134687 RepID=UPI0032DBCAC2
MIIDCIYKAVRTQNDLQHAMEILSTADILSGDSSIVRQYEKHLCEYFHKKHAIAVSSGTAALHASLVSTIKPGEEVLVPVICVPMTISAVLQAGGVPVFYDCRPDSFLPDLPSLENKITTSTQVLISVSMWGYTSLDRDTLSFCKKYGITIIEDAAQSAGTHSALGYDGTIGDIGCFSTHEFKLISTGEGGFILTDSDSYAEKIRSFTHIGFSESHKSFGYHNGLNYKLSAFQAAIGITQLANLDIKIQDRNARMAQWMQLTNSNHIHFMQDKNIIRHNGYSLCCLLDDFCNITGRELATRLYKKGINTDTFRYKNTIVCNYPLYADFYSPPIYRGDNSQDFPNATKLVRKMLVLPCHERVSNEAIKQAALSIQQIIEGS